MALSPSIDWSLDYFRQMYGFEPTVIGFGPGRVNIIGEHTDYNAGLVLPGALSQGVYVGLGSSIYDGISFQVLGDSGIFQYYVPWHEIQSTHQDPLVDECLGVLEAFGVVKLKIGLEIAFTETLPYGVGLSYSAAKSVALAVALNSYLKKGLGRLALAQLVQLSEQQRKGVSVGILDPFASLFGTDDHVLLLDCLSKQWTAIEVPKSKKYSWLLCITGVKHDHAQSGYETRVDEMKKALQVLKVHYPFVQSFRDVDLSMLDIWATENVLRKRVTYLINENNRVVHTYDYLTKGNFPAIGQVLLDGHAGLRDLYECSCPEIDYLISASEDHPDFLGGRIMGGGFGGSTINIIKTEGLEAYKDWIREQFEQAFEVELRFIDVVFSTGAYVAIPEPTDNL